MNDNIIGCEFGQTATPEVIATISEETSSLVDTTGPETEDNYVAPVLNGTTERDVQEYIINVLTTRNSFKRGERNGTEPLVVDKNDCSILPPAISPATGLDLGSLISFVKETQPQAWKYFVDRYDSQACNELERLVKDEKESRGTLDILRNGIPKVNDQPAITLLYNVSALDKESQALWDKNVWTVYDEVKYETGINPTRRIDLVISVNGIPIIAVELKNELTGQSTAHAEEQFRSTRSNLEPLLRPITGCIAYFSMGRREAAVTPTLMGANTKFMPFNKGNKGGKGNPDVEDNPELMGFRTHYMLDEIWTRECLTDILFNFCHVDTSKYNSLKHVSSEELTTLGAVFPRYHQIRLVRKIVAEYQKDDAQANAYLIQHSAGSGKTLSIAWLAHQLVSLLDDKGKTAFDHIVVVTDRVAIVRQLEDTINAINKVRGLVAEVTNTASLKTAFASGKRIIVSTVQKFGHLKEVIGDLANSKSKNFALIIDEAHSGQTGQNAKSIVDILGKSLADEAAELDNKIANLTYFAFTATPKSITLAKFGKNNKPYDLYPMRQAIQEGQILNVLKNYIRHEIFNKIHNSGEDKELPSSIYAKRAMNSYIRPAPENLEYKCAVILEHMVTSTLNNISGLGRGMVVVSSREDVYKYVIELRRQIKEYPELYGPVKPAGAFTDKISVKDSDTGVQKEYYDSDLNGFKDTEIPRRLAEENLDSPTMINLLVVADKYQTGFDEPLLCSMYVDKRLTGITAVQTLSRLNRVRKQNDKEDVAVLDFQDNESDIRKAFATYDVEARIKTHATAADLNTSALALYQYGIFTTEEINSYYMAHLLVGKEDNAATIMSNIVNKALDRIDSYKDSEDRDMLEAFENFKYEARNYIEDFIFVSQFREVSNLNLRGLHLFLKLILKLQKTPRGGVADHSWLTNIRVEIAQTMVSHKNLSGNKSEEELIQQEERKLGSKPHSPADSDRAITVEELVKEYNDRLKALILSAHGAESNANGEYSREQLDGFDLKVFEEIIEVVSQDPNLEEYSKHRSSQRFDSEQTRKLLKPTILDILLADKSKNGEVEGHINLLSLYSKNREFAERIEKYILNIVYQIFLRKRLDAKKREETK